MENNERVEMKIKKQQDNGVKDIFGIRNGLFSFISCFCSIIALSFLFSVSSSNYAYASRIFANNTNNNGRPILELANGTISYGDYVYNYGCSQDEIQALEAKYSITIPDFLKDIHAGRTDIEDYNYDTDGPDGEDVTLNIIMGCFSSDGLYDSIDELYGMQIADPAGTIPANLLPFATNDFVGSYFYLDMNDQTGTYIVYVNILPASQQMHDSDEDDVDPWYSGDQSDEDVQQSNQQNNEEVYSGNQFFGNQFGDNETGQEFPDEDDGINAEQYWTIRFKLFRRQ
jgi:hypothetical protein